MKNKSIALLCFVAFLFFFNSVFANKVDSKKAGQVALNFYVEHSPTNLSAKSLSITDNYVVSESSYVMYYVININSTGFVIVSGDDRVTPVLGYSYEGAYSDQDQSPEFTYWVGIYKKQILDAITTGYIPTADINAQWTRLAVANDEFTPEKGTKSVAPLTQSTWDQISCYNTLCPADATGPGGHCVTGCVATTMGQIMYYYRYPTTGQGSHSYNAGTYGTLSANFGTATYDYNAMTNSCVSATTDIAKLIYHAGVSVEMNYSPTGSGADMGTAASSMVTYFKYSSNIKSAYKGFGYTDAQWQSLITTDLDANRPIMYSGTDPAEGGHAWVCDGYQSSTYFHFNWGWSGAANGYYYLTALTPSGYNFTSQQNMVYNIYPASGYPYYCTGTKNITTPVGTIDDGSGPSNYQNNDNCEWLIAPAGAEHLVFDFNNLNTESGNDVVTFYDGPTTASPVLGAYSGSTVPTTITSTSPEVLINFTTNGSSVNTGWFLSYRTIYPSYCSGTTSLTAVTDTFSDGSGSNYYNNNVNCKWQIAPPNATSVTLNFLDFNTETSSDVVRVIDPVSSTILGTFSGTTLPSPVTSPSGQMTVIFTSNGSLNDPGWTAYYTSTLSGIEDYTNVKQFSYYPNPAKDMLHISFNIANNNDAKLELMTITGQVIYSENLAGNSAYSKDINLSSFAKGIYYIRLVSSGDIINKKVVIE